MEDARKTWISNGRNMVKINDLINLSSGKFFNSNILNCPNRGPVFGRNISNTINTDLIDYNVSSFFRSIPSFRDGLKKSQRQVFNF